jgi:hypothetical protein
MVPLSPSPPSSLCNYVRSLHLNSEDKRMAIRLDRLALLQQCFPEPLPNQLVHVVIQLPTILRRARTEPAVGGREPGSLIHKVLARFLIRSGATA